MSFRSFLLLCLIAVFTPSLLRAQESQWQNLSQIRPGAKVQVVETSLKTTTGKFVGFSEADFTLKVESGEVVIPKAQVYRVSIIGKKRKRNALIGLAVGTGAGAAWAAGMRNTENWRTGDSAGLIGGCAGIGAGIGALIPSASTKTVYVAEAPKQASLQGR